MTSSQSSATRASLISRARVQESQAWCELVDLYGPLIAHWCQRCGLSAHQSADCVQEVFASVARSLQDFDSRKEHGSFRAWLWTITANKAKDNFRKNRRHVNPKGGSTALGEMEQFPDTATVPDIEPSDAEQVSALISRGLAQVRREFQPRTWDIFRRVVMDQIPTAVVAQEFCVSPAAVRQARSRVLRRLRQQLGDLEDER